MNIERMIETLNDILLNLLLNSNNLESIEIYFIYIHFFLIFNIAL